MSDSVWPHRWQPTRLPRPWDSPGKNTGVGWHFLLQSVKVKSESEVAQLFPTLSDPRDCSLPGSSIHGIFQARVLEWGGIAFSRVVIFQHNFCLNETDKKQLHFLIPFYLCLFSSTLLISILNKSPLQILSVMTHVDFKINSMVQK